MRPARSGTPLPAVGAGDGSRLLETLPVLDLLRACRRLGDLWRLGPETMATLLGTSRTTWLRWLESLEAAREPLWTSDQRARALALLRIFQAVGDLHSSDANALAWPHERLEGPGFAGRTPLEVMQTGFEGILLVHDYLNFLLESRT